MGEGPLRRERERGRARGTPAGLIWGTEKHRQRVLGTAGGVPEYPPSSVGFLTGELPVEPLAADLEQILATDWRYEIDFADVSGQESAKRALTVAAAGHHNVLMLCP